MSGQGTGILTRDFEVLFGVGTVAGLTDAQLLKQFTKVAMRVLQAAFAALIARHGPMVLRVCGATLHDLNDVEDAFQATFLILARKARWIRDPGSVGSWLFGWLAAPPPMRGCRRCVGENMSGDGLPWRRVRWPRKIETISSQPCGTK